MIDKSSQNRPQNKYSLNVDGHDALDMANDINDYFSKIATDDTYDLDSIQEAIANYTHVNADHTICTLNNFEVCKMLMSIKKNVFRARWYSLLASQGISQVVSVDIVGLLGRICQVWFYDWYSLPTYKATFYDLSSNCIPTFLFVQGVPKKT